MMNIEEMNMDQVEARIAEIGVEAETAEEAKLDSLAEERDALEARKNAILAEIENRKADIANVVNGNATEIIEENIIEEKHKMSIEEIRSSKEYVDAFANYIKTDRDDEVRALLSTNATAATGYVPVPTIVEDRIRTAWQKLGLMDLVKKTYIKGNLQVGFEYSATDAVVHAEGAAAPTEEELVLGIISLTASSLKKWITISDEALDQSSESFLNYVYDELTYRIAKLAQENIIALIESAPTTATTSAVSVTELAGSPSLGIVAEAISNLSDECANPVIVMNKLTWAAFKEAQYAAGYAVDPFEGLPVFFDNSMAEYDSSSNDAWMIVGDFGVGAQANFPNGDEITIKYDNLSLAEMDLVKLVGREFVALGLVSDKCFCRVVGTPATQSE